MSDLAPYLEAAAGDWPGLRVAEGVFAEWIAARPGSLPTHAGDLYLACACAHNSDGALAAFERGYMSLVDGFVARHRLPQATLDDLKQQLRERLFVTGRIRDYSGQGALKSWLRVVAVRAAVD